MNVNPPGSAGVDAEQPVAQENEVNNNKERAIVAANPNMHWTDVMMQAEKSHIVDIRDAIQGKINKI